MKVHTSNYEIQGFTAEVSEKALADLAHSQELPMAVDLGSGALTDMTAFGLPQERTPMETLADGADLVTFSGDKLLGGPQAGLDRRLRRPYRPSEEKSLKRAIRCDKMTLAALDTVLGFYENRSVLPKKYRRSASFPARPTIFARKRPVLHQPSRKPARATPWLRSLTA